jgi:hypothetical protein
MFAGVEADGYSALVAVAGLRQKLLKEKATPWTFRGTERRRKQTRL